VINNLNFSYDDAYCVTVGGTDRSVFVWKTDIEEEIRERKTYPDFLDKTNLFANELSPILIASATNEEGFSTFQSKDSVHYSVASSMIHSMPWKGAVSEPSVWKEPENIGIYFTN